MSVHSSCVVHQFPVPDREYCAAPARRGRFSRLRRRPTRSPLLPLMLAGLSLFLCGFLLGRAGAVGEEAPSPEETPIVVQTFPVLPDGGTASEEDWRLILVNKDHSLPEDFQIPKLTQLRNGHAVDSRAYPELQGMMDACRAEGLEPLICSSYRSREKQAELFENKVRACLSAASSRQEAEEQAAQWVSRPGTSEHQAGLALDIVDKSYQMLDEGQEKTPVQKWLIEHCAEYGFILRYPTAKSEITGIGYEPWHYRYVGAEAAQEIMRRGLCLEEYLGLA